MKTLGQRNCNPLNIRFSGRNRWNGMTGQNKGFCVFSNMDYGYRAAVIVLRNYLKKGITSLYQIIRRWAPESENDTNSYYRYVEGYVNDHFDDSFETSTLYAPNGCRDWIVSFDSIPVIVCAMAYLESRLVVEPDHIRDVIVRYKIKSV